MKIKNITDIDGFFKVIDSCQGKVELITGEGDRLNLKSKLCQYVSLTSILKTDVEIPELELVAYEPANTGNIGRTCVATGTRLHLIEPLGFHLDEKAIKRAGMDYWSELDVTTYVNWEDFCEKNPGAKIYMATTKGRHVYTEVSYEPDCYIMFGKESAGIPEEILKENPDTCVRIPMIGETRSLNLSNSVAIVLYEALRQNQFDHMKLEGQLHRLSWDD